MVTRFRTGDDGFNYIVERPDHHDFRSMLREQRRFRLEQLHELDADAAHAGGPMAEVVAALREAAQTALADVDAALARMDSGSYGLCTRCAQPILPERLEILPMAAMCMTCQRGAEGAAD